VDQPKFYEIVGRALVDAEFRNRLLDPDQRTKALAEHGIEPGDDAQQALEGAIGAVEELSRSMGGGGVVAS
jgi:hypothetical protein